MKLRVHKIINSDSKNTHKTDCSGDLGELAGSIRGKGPAPVHLWDPPFCGDINILIKRDGNWFHEGSLIRRQNMVRLFSTILRLDADGDYYLVTPVEKLRIQVEDCPFVANQMDVELIRGKQIIVLKTNVNEVLKVGAEHPISIGETSLRGEPRPVVHVRDGLEALINRAIFYRLVELAVCVSDEVGVWSSGRFYSLGKS